MTQLHAREMPAPKRDRHGNIIDEAPLKAAEEPVVEEKVEEKAKAPAKKKAASKKKAKK
tara:strand:+ start:222 stop:398 length:177 start_codon:yes stop_codon:yes gene_type:complete